MSNFSAKQARVQAARHHIEEIVRRYGYVSREDRAAPERLAVENSWAHKSICEAQEFTERLQAG